MSFELVLWERGRRGAGGEPLQVVCSPGKGWLQGAGSWSILLAQVLLMSAMGHLTQGCSPFEHPGDSGVFVLSVSQEYKAARERVKQL